MKLQCACGEVIVDSGRADEVRGHILRAQSFETAYRQPSERIAEFIEAVAAGKREEWIESFYGRPHFDIPDASVVFDIISWARHRSELAVYQCERCGRLYVERQPQQTSGTLRSFRPEDADWKGTLADDQPG